MAWALECVVRVWAWVWLPERNALYEFYLFNPGCVAAVFLMLEYLGTLRSKIRPRLARLKNLKNCTQNIPRQHSAKSAIWRIKGAAGADQNACRAGMPEGVAVIKMQKAKSCKSWIPACAGMTERVAGMTESEEGRPELVVRKSKAVNAVGGFQTFLKGGAGGNFLQKSAPRKN